MKVQGCARVIAVQATDVSLCLIFGNRLTCPSCRYVPYFMAPLPHDTSWVKEFDLTCSFLDCWLKAFDILYVYMYMHPRVFESMLVIH